MNETPRRTFLKKSAIGTLGASLAPNLLFGQGRIPANEKVQVALIGCRNKGYDILDHHLKHGGARCVALCDVDAVILAESAAKVERDHGQKPKTYGDFRNLLEDPDVDAVIIGTPDHWHCLPLVYACEAGKDVYVEKPLANSIEECDIMVRAVRKYRRVVTVGQQQRSGDSWLALMDFLKSGLPGKLRKVNIWANFNYGLGSPKQPDQPVPPGVDYDFWLGPAPDRTFNPTRFHGKWRMFWDYGGGLMTDWGVHLIDMALWVKDVKADPSEVLAYGKNLSFPGYNRETYDTMSVTFPMDDYVINWEHTAGIQSGPYDRSYGIEFIGDDATIVADRRGWEVFPEDDGSIPRRPVSSAGFQRRSHGQSMEAHVANFIDCVKTREEPACPIEVGRQVAVYAHLANIAVRSGEGLLKWNADAGQTQSAAANAFLVPEYRKPWTLPKV